MEHLKEYIQTSDLWHSFIFIGVALILFFISKLLYHLSHKNIAIANELVEKDNFAFSISYVGYLAATIVVIGASIIGDSYGLVNDLIHIATFSIIGFVLLNISIGINNLLILPKFNIKKEIIEDQNSGTGLIEASVALGVSFILFGSLIGESDDILHGILTFVIYWLIGNVLLIITSKVFTKWINYDIHDEIERDNVAAGISFSGIIIAMSIIIMNALIAPFEDWTTTLLDVGIQSVLGMVLLPIIRFITDKVLLPGQKLTDEIVNQEKPNKGAALIEAFAYIGAALLIAWSI